MIEDEVVDDVIENEFQVDHDINPPVHTIVRTCTVYT